MQRSSGLLLALIALLAVAVVTGIFIIAPSGGGGGTLPPSGLESQGSPPGPSPAENATTAGGASSSTGASATRSERAAIERGYLLHGRLVADEPGASLAGVEVFLCDRPAPRSEPRQTVARLFGAMAGEADWERWVDQVVRAPERFRAQVQTAGDGTFEIAIEELPDPFYLWVVNPLFAQGEVVRYQRPQPREGEPVTPMDLQVPVRLAGGIRGRVLDENGRPLAGALVYLREQPIKEIPDMTNSLPPLPRRAHTDGQGRFALRAVLPYERYLLRAASGTGAERRSGMSEPFALHRGELLDREIRAGRGVELRGRVVDGQQRGLAGIDVLCLPSENSFAAMEPTTDSAAVEVRTDAEGRFLASGLLPIVHVVIASGGGFAPSAGRFVDLSKPAEELVVVLDPGRALRGRALLPGGAPAAGALITLRQQFSPQLFLNAAGRALVPWQAAADAQGAFSFDSLPDSTFDLLARSADGAFGARVVGLGKKKLDKLIEVQLEPLVFLAGTVADAAGDPVSDFTIELQRAMLVVMPATVAASSFHDERGRFRIEGLRKGTYKLLVRAEGYPPHYLEKVAVPSPDNAPLKILLPARAGARGIVRAAGGGAPIAGATVALVAGNPLLELRDQMAGTRIETLSDEEGRFELLCLPAGTFSLVAEHPDWAPAKSPSLEIPAGQIREDIFLEMSVGGIVEGTVWGKDGAALADVMVQVKFGAPFFLNQKTAHTDERGFYRVAGLPKGSVQVTAIKSFPLTKSGLKGIIDGLEVKTAQVALGAATVVDFGASGAAQGTRVSGKVTDHAKPVRGVMIFANEFENAPAGMDMRFAMTDRKGVYSFAGLPAGKCKLRVVHMGGSGQSVHTFPIEIPQAPEYTYDIALMLSSLSGGVHTPQGEPLEGVQVQLRRRGGGQEGAEPFSAQARTDKNGRYSFEGLPAGRYTARAGGPEFIIGGAGNRIQQVLDDLEIQAGQEREGVDFVLAPGAILRGTVRDHFGRGIDGVTIFVTPEGKEFSQDAMQGMSSPAGKFQVQGLASGTYAVRAQRRGYATQQQSNVFLEAGGSAEVDLILPKGIRVRVRALDGEGAAIPGVRARLAGADGRPVQPLLGLDELLETLGAKRDPTVSDLGTYAPGSYRLEVEAPGHTKHSETIQLAPGAKDAAEFTVRLED